MEIYHVKGLLRWIIENSENEYLDVYNSVYKGKQICHHIDSNNIHPGQEKKAEMIVLYGDKCGNCGPDIIAVCFDCAVRLPETDWWGTSQCQGIYIMEIHDFRNKKERNVYTYNEFKNIKLPQTSDENTSLSKKNKNNITKYKVKQRK